MTTRAGVSGLITGCVLVGLLFYPLYIVVPGAYIHGGLRGSIFASQVLVVLAAAAAVAGGGWAAWWGGARSRARRAVLGAVAGSLAGLVAFFGLGAAAAGAVGVGHIFQAPREPPADAAWMVWLNLEAAMRTVWWTEEAFWVLAIIGTGLGAVGGLYVRPFPPAAGWEEFDRREPQMALNVAITAVPSAAAAALLAAVFFSGLPSALMQGAAKYTLTLTLSPYGTLTWPVVTALLMYLIALAALALVTPHEARQAEHRLGLDEVRMAAWVGIFVPPALAILLFLVNPALALTPTVLSLYLVSGALCYSQVMTLRRLILPKRATLPPPARRVEALLFGSIARSRGPRLVVLCLGCGLAVIAPLYVTVGAPVLSLMLMPSVLGGPGSAALEPASVVQRLFLAQAALGLGLLGGTALALIVIYLFYLWLGRRFSRTSLLEA